MRIFLILAFAVLFFGYGCSYNIANTTHNHYYHNNTTGSHAEHDSMEHLIEYFTLKLKKEVLITDYSTTLYELKDRNDNIYKMIHGSELALELTSDTFNTVTVNKIKIPIFNEKSDSFEVVDILVKSDNNFESREPDDESQDPIGTYRISNGGCIWRVLYSGERGAKELVTYTKSELDLGFDYEYAIPFPAVTHFRPLRAKEKLEPKLIMFPFNDFSYKKKILAYLEEHDKVYIGFYQTSFHKYHNPKLEVDLYYVDTLHFYSNNQSDEKDPEFSLTFK